MCMRLLLLLSFLLILCTLPISVTGTVGGDDWWWWNGPEAPPVGHCLNDTGYVENETPNNGEFDVAISDKGVQTCVDVFVPSGCNVTVTMEWLNWSHYFDVWIEWAYLQDWWWGYIDWDTEPTWENDSFWNEYYNSTTNVTDTHCVYNGNVSCYTDGDWNTVCFDWRVSVSYNCSGIWTNDTCNYYFEPEECAISYIYPPSPNGTACPCCDVMCVRVSNVLGHNMNITIYRNDSTFEDFYIVNKFFNVSNNTYCFCIDGHVNDSIYYPMMYNTTYCWYVNLIDTTTNESTNSSIYQFRTPPNSSSCPCGADTLDEFVEERDNIQDDIWILPVASMFCLIPFIYMRGKKR